MKDIKKECKKDIKKVFDAIVQNIIKYKVSSNKLRIVILPIKPLDENFIAKTTLSTLKEKQEFLFFNKTSSFDITELCIYEKRMSRYNGGMVMTIEEKADIKSIDKDKLEGYKDAITGFLIANIIW